jgi:hypothetical protein
MKHLTLLLLLLSASAFAQQKDSTVLKFSAYEKGELKDFSSAKEQLIKMYQQQDSLQIVFLRKFLVRNGIDLNRVSNHPDSLAIKPNEIVLKLRKVQWVDKQGFISNGTEKSNK